MCGTRSHLGSTGGGQAITTLQKSQSHFGSTNDVNYVTKNLTVRFLARSTQLLALVRIVLNKGVVTSTIATVDHEITGVRGDIPRYHDS